MNSFGEQLADFTRGYLDTISSLLDTFTDI